VSAGPERRAPDAPLPVYVAAGSNVAPLESLVRALTALAGRFPDLRVSPAYRNAAVGFEGEDFVNPSLGATIGELWARFDRARHPLERIELPWPAPRP